MTRILCIWFPNWPLQRLLRTRPELEGRAVALVATGPRGGRVVACSPTASAQGAHGDMPVAEAQALMHDLYLAPHDPPADRRALEKLAEACERFTPCVALEEADEPQSLLLDITDLEHLYGSEAKLISRIERWLNRHRYHTRLAPAPTIGLAWALAHFAEERVNDECRSDELPIEALRIPPETAALLRQLGIQTVNQLQSLPREDLTSRFGGDLLRRLDQFTGTACEVLHPYRGLPALQTKHELDEPTSDRSTLTYVIRHLVEQLARQLAARDQGAVLLVCRLNGPSENATPLRIGLVEPSANSSQLMELIELHLENVRLAAEVDHIELQVVVVGRLGERQGELFADRWPTSPHQLAVLANRLTSRLGHEQVLRAELRRSPVPERAVRLVAVTQCREGVRGRRGDKGKSSRLAHLPLSPSACVPLLLHPTPEPLEVVSVAPDGPPQFVWLNRQRQRIVHCTGPERIETLWWRGPTVRRDYYRVAAESGDHLWIFRRLTDARWFLHGAFQ